MAKTYIYKNLHKDTWSLMERGIVRAHSDNVIVESGEFRVRPAGREKVLREQRKTVHAFVVGYPVAEDATTLAAVEGIKLALGEPVQVSYNPYRGDTFYRKDTDESVESAELVELRPDSSVWAWGVKAKAKAHISF
jgi:hypothetical protein